MIGYYTITQVLKDALLEDVNVNTVTKGKFDGIDIAKQNMFPLSHIYIPNTSHEGALLRFSVEILLVDIEDITSEVATDIFIGNNNTDDIHNTQLAVGVRLIERLRKGDLFTDVYRLDGDATYEDITDEYENGLTGWRLSFDMLLEHDMTSCTGITPAYVKTYKSAKVLKTGQTTSYRTGDDGDLEKGRTTDFFTLPAHNPFSNTNRFTDELGGQDYTNNIIIDWTTYEGSEVLGYYNGDMLTDKDWNTAIDDGIALSVDTFTSNWRLPNFKELFYICTYELSVNGSMALRYSPINATSNKFFWTSTTYTLSSTLAYYIQSSSGVPGFGAKTTGTIRTIYCRDFTVTGTTLT